MKCRLSACWLLLWNWWRKARNLHDALCFLCVHGVSKQLALDIWYFLQDRAKWILGNDFFSVAPVFLKRFYMFLHNFFCLKYLEPPILVIFGHKIWNVIPCTLSGTPVGQGRRRATRARRRLAVGAAQQKSAWILRFCTECTNITRFWTKLDIGLVWFDQTWGYIQFLDQNGYFLKWGTQKPYDSFWKFGNSMAHQETLVDVARCVLDKSEMSWKTGWKLESMGDLQDPIDGGTMRYVNVPYFWPNLCMVGSW